MLKVIIAYIEYVPGAIIYNTIILFVYREAHNLLFYDKSQHIF